MLTDEEFDFLMGLLQKVKGIGKATASKVISKVDKFQEFPKVREKLLGVKGINPAKIAAIVKLIDRTDFKRPIVELRTEAVLMDFLESQYTMVENLHLNDLDINVLLVKALGFTTAEQTIEFYLYQRITRSVVTSWGQSAIESIARIAGSEKVPSPENIEVNGERFDVKKSKNGKIYYFQIKSGPNTMNVGMVTALSDMIKKIEGKNKDNVGMLGMTYGEDRQVSSQIRDNLVDYSKKAIIGKDFWEFLSGDKDYYKNLIKLIDKLSEQYEKKFDNPFLDEVRNKKDSLLNEWKKEYGDVGVTGLKKFLEKYTT